MARYFLRKNKQTNECDCCPDVGYDYSDFAIGMGPVKIGGPDKFDIINIKPKKKKRRRVK